MYQSYLRGGVFLRQYLKKEYYDSSFLISAVVAWLITAFILLIICTVLLSELGCSEQSLGYTSSIISFLSALAAGITASKKRKSGTIYTALLTASVLIIALLTLGFMIDGSALQPSAIMSIISFTFSGCLVGIILVLVPIKKKKRYRPNI